MTNIETVWAGVQKDIDQVATILNLNPYFVTLMLYYYKWDKDKLLERFMEDSDKVFEDSKVSLPSEQQSRDFEEGKIRHFFIEPAGKSFFCAICCSSTEDFKAEAYLNDGLQVFETFSLTCGHCYCVKCYSTYVSKCILDEGMSLNIECIEKCGLLLDGSSIKALVNEETFQQYLEMIQHSYIAQNPQYRWCPRPDCGNIAKCAVSRNFADCIAPVITCICGSKFCFGCGNEPHAPCLCEIAKWWAKKCSDDSETANWISVNTKDCPKCSSAIEKDGGCNHMTCRKCKHQWCWVCQGNWDDHGQSWYKCNKYDEEKLSSQSLEAEASSSKDKPKSMYDKMMSKKRNRARLDRYLHYWKRFENHMRSAKLSQKLYNQTQKNMEELQKESDLSWIEVQFLKRAVDVSVSCRETLKWTYAMAYYLKAGDHATTLFEDIQCDLELAVEHLASLIEAPTSSICVKSHKQEVIDKTEYVRRRQDILLKDAAAGFKEKRWKYSQEFASE